jgi:hypothetical protein
MVQSKVHHNLRTGPMVRFLVQRARGYVEPVQNRFGPNRTRTSAHCTGSVHVPKPFRFIDDLRIHDGPQVLHRRTRPATRSARPSTQADLTRCRSVLVGFVVVPLLHPLCAYGNLSQDTLNEQLNKCK